MNILNLNSTPVYGVLSPMDSSASKRNPPDIASFVVDGGEISMNSGMLISDDINRIFRAESIFTRILLISGEHQTLATDKDVTIPRGKTIWLNIYTTLKVSEGVTPTGNGRIETYSEPLIKGLVQGNKINVMEP